MPKKVKDFSPEERKLILKDVEEIGLQAAADKNDTTWQTIRSIKRMAEGRVAVRPTTQEERERIWQRVSEVGFAQAAVENSMTESTIRGWQQRFGMPKLELPITPATRTAGTKQAIARRKFSLEKKAEIVAQARKLGLTGASRIYNVGIGTISKWMKNFPQDQENVRQPQELNNELAYTEAETPQIREDAAQHEESVNNESNTKEAVVETQPAARVEIADNNNTPIEVSFSADVRALAARVQELNIEVAILKEKNAGLTQKIATLREAIKNLLQ